MKYKENSNSPIAEKSFAFRPLILAFSSFAILAGTAPAAVLIPNDSAISGSLDIWLSDAGNRFDGTTWQDASGNGNDAVAFGSNGTVTYLAGTASTQFSTTGVAFTGTTEDLMKAGSSYTGLTDVTIFTVFSTNVLDSTTRPVGLGSYAADAANAPDRFNQATDATLRYDNGRTDPDGAASLTASSLLVRASRMDGNGSTASLVTDWIGAAINIGTTADGPVSLGASSDSLYFGDLRAGATTVGSGSSTSGSDLFISQVIVYKSALTDQQVVDVSNWLAANPSAVPEPSSLALLGLGGLALILRRRK